MEIERNNERQPAEDQALHPELTGRQIDRLRPYGEVRSTRLGDILFQEGDVSYNFFVILEGIVEIVDRSEDEEKVIAVDGPGLFLGELNLLTGQSVYLTARVREAGAVLSIPPERLRRVIAEEPELSDLILGVFIARRAQLVEEATSTLKIVGSRFSPDTLRLRSFAARSELPHTWIDPDADEEAETLLREFGVAPEETPVVVWQGRELMRNPSESELAGRIGLRSRPAPDETYDLVVVGAGPAGLAAAVYGASEGLSTLCLERVAPGGQASASSKIENYPGFPAGLSGTELARRTEVQARKFGARIASPSAATGLRREGGFYVVALADGDEVVARSVVVATGARYRKLPLERLEAFEGAGVYYAATETEAQTCRGEPVAVVGGGNSAGQAAMFLSERASEVHLLIRGADLSKSMSRYLARRIEERENVALHTHTEVARLTGEDRLEELALQSNASEGPEEQTLGAKALFVFIGAEPHTAWLEGALALDAGGFVQTGRALQDGAGENGHAPPALMEASWPGVFAAGDVRAGSTKRVASAVGEGAVAVKLVHEYLAGA